jgi:hypothetical protein
MSVTVRMYRQGLGDCFLVGFPKANGGIFRVLIDCGVILGQRNAEATMRAVVSDILNVTGGSIDLLIATHEHWDHLSGFIQAASIFQRLAIGQVWLAWTENPNDSQAKELKAAHSAALTALRLSENKLRFYGITDQADQIAAFLDFFGTATGGTTGDALEAVRAFGKGSVRYCDPNSAPIILNDAGVRCYILGPPRDEKLLKTLSESANSPEMYGIDTSCLSVDAAAVPFDAMQLIPTAVAREIAFFKQRYFGGGPSALTDAPSWRRIDVSYLDAASALALQLDSYTNNTSLVVAFERANGEVMLFPGDAQIGSWLSWRSLSWNVNGATVRGPELLARATFYKVGHHGSHNGTAKANGLHAMKKLQQAAIPVDHNEAVKKGWDRMPLPEILATLEQQAPNGVVRADSALPLSSTATANDLFYELVVP